MTLTALLALFVLLAISCLTYFASARFKVPYTVLLVAVGLLLVPIAQLPLFSFLKDFQFTPELLFYLFLPALIFESSYNMRVRSIQQNIYAISFLSILSLLLSTAFVTLGLHVIFQMLGLAVPPIVLLLFGVLISATDPVAVLALFKQYGVPHRLSLMFEGESLFNDGTAVALFLVVLEVAFRGYHGVSTVGEGLFLFTSMVIGGIAFGLFMGLLFSKLLEVTRSNENVSIILMLVVAHITFILSEIISHSLVISGVEIKVSAIIATTIASVVVGNYGRYKIAPQAHAFVDKYWSQFAFMINSLVFILMGLLFAALPINMADFILPIAVAILVVAVGRALSIYPVVGLLNWLKVEERVPTSWQHLLAWGSLRGALAITMVMLIPADWRPQGWSYAYPPQHFIMALTIGCIYATLFIKALTIGPMIRKMGLDSLTDVEKLEYKDASAYLHTQVTQRMDALKDKGYIDATGYTAVKAKLDGINTAAQKRHKVAQKPALTHAALNIHALGIERSYLHDLFTHGEISDRVMRRIQAMISDQLHQLEHGHTLGTHPGSVPGDWLDNLTDALHKLMSRNPKEQFTEKFLYYRAKAIIARKVTKEMAKFSADNVKLFAPAEVKPVIDRYHAYQQAAEAQVAQLLAAHGTELAKVSQTLATRAATKLQQQLLDELLQRELISPKVHISLRNQL